MLAILYKRWQFMEYCSHCKFYLDSYQFKTDCQVFRCFSRSVFVKSNVRGIVFRFFSKIGKAVFFHILDRRRIHDFEIVHWFVIGNGCIRNIIHPIQLEHITVLHPLSTRLTFFGCFVPVFFYSLAELYVEVSNTKPTLFQNSK